VAPLLRSHLGGMGTLPVGAQIPSRKVEQMDRTFLLAGAVAGLIAVAFGAFGAHGLRGRLTPEMLAVFETGVRYHMYHALALVLVAALSPRLLGKTMAAAGWLFVAGIALFSGRLYLLAVTGVTVLGAI